MPFLSAYPKHVRETASAARRMLKDMQPAAAPVGRAVMSGR